MSADDAGGRRPAVRIDGTRCEGTGFCVRLAPDHFAIGGEGTSVFLTPEQIDEELVEEAEAMCPLNAIDLRRT